MPRRLALLRGVVLIAVLLCLGRLVQLQILEGSRNRQLADENRIRIARRPAPRGNIYDRSGRLLAGSRLAFSVGVVPEQLGPGAAKGAMEELAALLGLPPEEVGVAIERRREAPYEPVIVCRDASKDLVARLEERSVHLAGITVLPQPVRYYPHGPLAAHVLGYVRQISAAELAQLEDSGYRPYDLIGKAGVEKAAERFLRGTDGGEQIEVDAGGHRIRTLGSMRSRPGSDIWLTIDLVVQRAAEEAIAGRAGSVVAMEPWTGEILGLVSHPGYDPNLFVGALSPGEWARLSGPDHPQHNRAVMSSYPPGSLLKIVTAAAALEAGCCDAHTSYRCDGSYRLRDWSLRCWKPGGHGTIRLTEGIAQSCNAMFAHLGRSVGPDALAEMAHRFGLGYSTGIDLPQETSGLVPTPGWKQARRREPWYPGDTCQMAIGQGDCLVTPVQIARLVAAVANGGQVVQPHVIARVDEDRWSRQPTAVKLVGLHRETLSVLRSAMEAVVGPEGSAGSIKPEQYSMAGKTGTAQTSVGPAHSWFMGYAPADGPRLAVSVIVEHGENGGATAAPIARHVFDTALLPEDQRQGWPPEEAQIAQAVGAGG